MGTRGLFGFYFKSKYYLIYNHFDSYPDGLGDKLIKEIIEAIKNGELDKWMKMLLDIKIVSTEKQPTTEDITELEKYTNLEVSYRSKNDWYCLLYKTQGSFKKVLESGYLLIEPNSEKLQGDIFIEYSYVLDFDNKIFRFFASEGYQTKLKLTLEELDKWNEEKKLYYDLSKH